MRAELGDTVTWLPGATAFQALRSLRNVGPARRVPRAHDGRRGSFRRGSAAPRRAGRRDPTLRRAARREPRRAPPRALDRRGLAREIAVSEFVASRVERSPRRGDPERRSAVAVPLASVEPDGARSAAAGAREGHDHGAPRLAGVAPRRGGLDDARRRRRLTAGRSGGVGGVRARRGRPSSSVGRRTHRTSSRTRASFSLPARRIRSVSLSSRRWRRVSRSSRPPPEVTSRPWDSSPMQRSSRQATSRARHSPSGRCSARREGNSSPTPGDALSSSDSRRNSTSSRSSTSTPRCFRVSERLSGNTRDETRFSRERRRR